MSMGLSLGLRLGNAASGSAGFAFAPGASPSGSTFTRASTGFAYNSSGTLASNAIDVLRDDYNPFTLAWRGKLIEPASTNLFLQSQNFALAWTAGNVTAATATRIVENTATASHRMQQAVVETAGQVVTQSVSAWEVAGSAKRYLHLRDGASGRHAGFDLATGTVAYSANCTTSVVRIGTIGGLPVWRCSITYTAITVSGATGVWMSLGSNATVSYTGDGVSGIEATDVQFEVSPRQTSIIPTTAASVTRAADALVLNWASRGVADGSYTMRYSFDDNSTQNVATTVAGGNATVPTDLNRAWIKSVVRV